MCDPPHKRHKYLDEPYIPPNQGYRNEPPMTTGAGAGAGGARGFKPAVVHEPPQYAEFDVSKKSGAHEDALPAMPSWEGAGSKKVVLQDEAVEMENLKKPDNAAPGMSLMAGPSRGVSPATPESRSPYGAPLDGHGASNPYLAAGAAGADPYAVNDQGYDRGYDQGYNGNPRGYGPSSSSLGVDQYGMAGAGAMGPGRRSPRGYNGDGYSQDQSYPQSRSQQGSYDDFRRNGSSPQPMGYDMGNRSPNMPNMMGGAAGGYGDPTPRTNYSRGGGGGYDQGRYGAPKRQYSSDSTQPLARPSPQHQNSYGESPSPNLQNNSGFDFNSGYSRPDTRGRDESYDYAQPQPAGGPQGGYPGYKAYTPQDNPGRPHDGWN